MAVKGSTKGAMILFLLVVIALAAWFFVKPFIDQRSLRSTSDAAGSAQQIRIGGDNYVGYWFINSPEMRKLAPRKGINIEFNDDGGAYKERLEKFAQDEYECIVLPVNSYLEHGKKWNYPGVIVAAISESKGADGIVGYNLGSKNLNILNNPSLSFVYTSDSPSEFLMDLLIHDFDLDQLRTASNWRMEVGSSEEVYKAAKNNKGDVFVAWEPDITRILELEGMSYIFGSDNFRGYIIDVFVFNRKFIKKHRMDVINFFHTYYRTLGIYANNKERMYDEMKKSTKLKQEKLEVLTQKIEWFDLAENCSQMFGISSGSGAFANDGLINCIISCTDIMMSAKVVSEDPLKGDPYLIVDSSVLEEMNKTAVVSTSGKNSAQKTSFASLSDAQWKALPEAGTFKVRDITFQSWNNNLTPEGENTVDKSAALLVNNYPDYRIIVRGHTGKGGDEKLNIKKSLEQAQVAAQRLIAVYGIDPNRIRAEGLGSGKPPKRIAGESYRAYQYRMNRVEFIALKENPF